MIEFPSINRTALNPVYVVGWFSSQDSSRGFDWYRDSLKGAEAYAREREDLTTHTVYHAVLMVDHGLNDDEVTATIEGYLDDLETLAQKGEGEREHNERTIRDELHKRLIDRARQIAEADDVPLDHLKDLVDELDYWANIEERIEQSR